MHPFKFFLHVKYGRVYLIGKADSYAFDIRKGVDTTTQVNYPKYGIIHIYVVIQTIHVHALFSTVGVYVYIQFAVWRIKMSFHKYD